MQSSSSGDYRTRTRKSAAANTRRGICGKKKNAIDGKRRGDDGKSRNENSIPKLKR